MYRDLADDFGAHATPDPEWSDLEKDMLGVIGLDRLLEIERRPSSHRVKSHLMTSI